MDVCDRCRHPVALHADDVCSACAAPCVPTARLRRIERERFLWLLRARHRVFSRVPVETPETRVRVRALLEEWGLAQPEELSDRDPAYKSKLAQRIETAHERSRRRAHDIARSIGHEALALSDVGKAEKPKSGLLGSTAYVDARSAQGMIEMLLRYPPSHPHGCPACEPPVAWDCAFCEGEIVTCACRGELARDREVTAIEAELMRRWHDIEQKLVKAGDPPSCSGRSGLDMVGWRHVWTRRRQEGLPNVLPKETDAQAARAERLAEEKLLATAQVAPVEEEEPEPELDPKEERVVTMTRSAAGEIQYAFARKRPKVPGDEDVARVPDRMGPEEIRRATEEGKQALNRVFLLGGNA